MNKGWERISHLFDRINIVVIPAERVKCPKLLPPEVRVHLIYKCKDLAQSSSVESSMKPQMSAPTRGIPNWLNCSIPSEKIEHEIPIDGTYDGVVHVVPARPIVS